MKKLQSMDIKSSLDSFLTAVSRLFNRWVRKMLTPAQLEPKVYYAYLAVGAIMLLYSARLFFICGFCEWNDSSLLIKAIVSAAVTLSFVLTALFSRLHNRSGIFASAALPASAAVYIFMILDRSAPGALIISTVLVLIALGLTISSSPALGKSKKQRTRGFISVYRRMLAVLLTVIVCLSSAVSFISLSVRAHSDSAVIPTDLLCIDELDDHPGFVRYISRLRADVWQELSMTERVEALQTAANYLCSEYGVDPLEIKAAPVEMDHAGEILRMRSHKLYISVEAIEESTPTTSLYLLCRGFYNARQTEAVRLHELSSELHEEIEPTGSAVRWSRYINGRGNSRWRYQHPEIKLEADQFAFEECRILPYMALEYGLEWGEAALSQPLTIRDMDCRVAVYPEFVELFFGYEEQKLISGALIFPEVSRFEDIALTAASVCSSDSGNELIFVDRGTQYSYFCEPGTLYFTLSGSAPAPESEPAVTLPPSIDWNINPIDDFFDRHELSYETYSNADIATLYHARAELWTAELYHAYELMKQTINPMQPEQNQREQAEMLDRALESFLIYADEGAHIEATAAASNVFATGEDVLDGAYAGTALSGFYMQLRGDMIRAEVLRMYGILEHICYFESTEDAFIFDEEKFLESVYEKYDIILEGE